MNKAAIYPGTFDPITNGHIDVIRKSLKFVDKVIVGISEGIHKNHLFSIDERIEIIQKEFESRSIKILSSGFDRIPKTSKQLPADQQEEVLELIEKIQEDDDVQNVYHAMEIQE